MLKKEGVDLLNKFSKYRIFETNQFLKDIDKNLGQHKLRIETKLKIYIYPQLKENPFFGKNIKKLKSYNPDTWRYRVGDYRFFYIIDDIEKVVFMISAEHRRSAY